MKAKIEMPLKAYSKMQNNRALAEGIKNIAIKSLKGDPKTAVVTLADIYVDLAEAIDKFTIKDNKDE